MEAVTVLSCSEKQNKGELWSHTFGGLSREAAQGSAGGLMREAALGLWGPSPVTGCHRVRGPGAATVGEVTVLSAIAGGFHTAV